MHYCNYVERIGENYFIECVALSNGCQLSQKWFRCVKAAVLFELTFFKIFALLNKVIKVVRFWGGKFNLNFKFRACVV